MSRFSRFPDRPPPINRFSRNPQESDSFFQSTPWLDLRYKVLRASKGCCHLCGTRGDANNPLQVDHIKPRSRYPGLALDAANCQVLCRNCNLGKSNKDLTDWRFEPSRELSILNSLDPANRFRLQQLGWLKAHGENAAVRSEANREYRKVWRQIEDEWIATNQAAQ